MFDGKKFRTEWLEIEGACGEKQAKRHKKNILHTIFIYIILVTYID